jgi:metal-sulfur cluster biosynthetic enzyme
VSVPNGTLTVEDVREALDRVKDPCMQAAGLDLSILDLGLVYGVEVHEGGSVRVDLTLTELGCIFTHRVFGAVYDAVEALPGVKEVEVVPRWSPVWTPERLNQKATRALEGSRNAMFRVMKGRGLQQAASGNG